MSFDDASCFCTGPAGKTVSTCSSPAALAGLCASQGQPCSDMTGCCDGLSCSSNGTVTLCQQTCSIDANCASGCCTDRYDTGVTICADADACKNPCKKHGESCQAGLDTPNDCCRGSCVTSDNPDFSGCRPDCTTNADCSDTGCCVPFANDSSAGFCADARYCSCGALDAQCGSNDPTCCTGNVCAGAGSGANQFKCYKGCTANSDCPNADCVTLSDGSASICYTTANDCGKLGDVCGGNNASCCKGTTCGAADNTNFSCYPSCATTSDCAAGVCHLFSDGSGGFCAP
jgi:hypothetical protein